MNVRIDKVMDISAYACYISLLYFRDANIYLTKGFHIYSCEIGCVKMNVRIARTCCKIIDNIFSNPRL